MHTTARALRIGIDDVHPSARDPIIEFLARAIARGRERLAAARQAREARALLLGMSDRDLRDIGLTRFELHRLYNDARL